jgi:hypothetical protein
MFALVLAVAISSSTCPMTIGIGSDGSIFTDRFHGWYRVSTTTLQSDLTGGCYKDANPIPVTSVRLFLSSSAPRSRIDSVMAVLNAKGWSRDKIDIEPWRSYPQAP